MSAVRKACPFYGFQIVEGAVGSLLIDQGGNQCALIADKSSPCVMEVHLERAPQWFACPLRGADSLVTIWGLRKNAFVFPHENEGGGVTFSEWMDARLKPTAFAAAATACTCGRGAVDENPNCPLHAGSRSGV